MRTVLTHAIFIIVTVGLGILSGVGNAPGEWYQALQKPFFNPPPWVFAPVWTTLYVLIGIAGARVWLRAPRSTASFIWFAQAVLNFLWSPAFFGMQSPALGLVVILGMLALIFAFIVKAKPIDSIASKLFYPYAAWVSFATVLNFSILLLN